MATGTVTITPDDSTVMKCVKFAWTATAGGAASDTTTTRYSGKVTGLVTVPDSGTAPSPNYDITITDKNGLDILTGSGADRHTSNTEYVREASLGNVANSVLTLNVSGAGSGGKGTVYVFIR